MKIEELEAKITEQSQEVQAEVVEGETDEYQDLTQALNLLESCMRLMGFLSDKELVPKFRTADRDRLRKMSDDVKVFIDQWNWTAPQPEAGTGSEV